MAHQKSIRMIFSVIFLSGLGCMALTGPLTRITPQPTSTPNEDATAAAIATDIGMPPSAVAWMSTVNAIGTQGMPGDSIVYDGNWAGDGFTIDGTDIKLVILVTNNKITDVAVDYKGTDGASCLLRASATNQGFKADFLPAEINSMRTAYFKEWGFTATFNQYNSAMGSMDIEITNQAQANCNMEIKATWIANKK